MQETALELRDEGVVRGGGAVHGVADRLEIRVQPHKLAVVLDEAAREVVDVYSVERIGCVTGKVGEQLVGVRAGVAGRKGEIETQRMLQRHVVVQRVGGVQVRVVPGNVGGGRSRNAPRAVQTGGRQGGIRKAIWIGVRRADAVDRSRSTGVGLERLGCRRRRGAGLVRDIL